MQLWLVDSWLELVMPLMDLFWVMLDALIQNRKRNIRVLKSMLTLSSWKFQPIKKCPQIDVWLSESLCIDLKPWYNDVDVNCTFLVHGRPHLRYFLLSNKLEQFQFRCGKLWFEKHLKKFLQLVIHFILRYQSHLKPFTVLPWHFCGFYVCFGKFFIT